MKNRIIILALMLAICSLLSMSDQLAAQPAPPHGENPDKPDLVYAVVADKALADFDKFVDTELKKWNTPGIAITVVKDGKVILKRGYGYRDLDKKLPMTELTVQPIASVTKSFTVAALATLVREGKLSWDKPVRDYLQDFKLYSDYATLNVTPRDLVTHRTGLPRHDFSWFNSTATREELYKRLPYLEPSAPLRTRWQYNNFMYMTAGYMGGKIAGSDWETLVRKNIFLPLGMQTANFTIEDLLKSQNVGRGYTWDDKDVPKAIPYSGLTAMGPTGAINASIEDMSRYLRMLLASGKWGDKTIVNFADLIEMTNPQMVIADDRRYAEISSTQYGMGFFLTHYRGERLVHHGGNMPGASSLLSFLPQKKIGVFTTTNISGSQLPRIVSYAIYDRLLGMSSIDWSARFWDVKEKSKASEESAKKQNLSPQKKGTRPAHQLDAYVGDYTHPGYSAIRIAETGDGLLATYNGISSLFPHYHYEVFRAPDDKLNQFAKQKIQFVTNIDGDINSVLVALEPNVKPIEFVRQTSAQFKDRTFLKQFVGEYDLGATKITITLRDDGVLISTTPGQTPTELVGISGKKFSLKSTNGTTIEFLPDKAGKITQAAVYQQSGNFVATRKN